MQMVDSAGHILGHDIRPEEIPDYKVRPDVTFLSDDFVMYPNIPFEGQTYMELLSVPYHGQGNWVPDSTEAVLWFASRTSSDMIHDYFGLPKGDLATAMIGLNL